MGRKTTIYRVEDKGRDYNKAFLLTEMSSAQAESWAMRVLLALMANNKDIPEIDPQLGMAGLVRIGLGAIFSTCPVRRSKRVSFPPYTMSGSSGSGAA